MVVFDTNILIDFLKGVPSAQTAIDKNRQARISIITWIETLVGARSESEDAVLRAFLAGFEIVPLSSTIAEGALQLKRTHGLKIPDAIILATAQDSGATLWTRNVRDFPPKQFKVHVPYTI